VLLHCAAGKDRAGVVTLILKTLGLSAETVVEEYMLSEGVKPSDRIEQCH